MGRGRVNERTFYPALSEVIRASGGSAVQEVTYNSVPDIIFRLANRPWILSVKIGQELATIKEGFLQYLRHKEESNIPFGILLILPDKCRTVPAREDALSSFIRHNACAALIDAGTVKEEIRGRSFPKIIEFLQTEVIARLKRKERAHYPMPLVISLLKQHVVEMMQEIKLDESSILEIVTDRKLLMDLGHLRPAQVEDVARFLASYIVMSQALFLRLLASAKPDLLVSQLFPVTHKKARTAFKRVLEINYRDIFDLDVLDSISDSYLRDTFELIWGLAIEQVQHELPGRIFHELMPAEIRKMLAAFYTRPLAADLLSALTIRKSGDYIFDPACGSGTILVSAYRRKRYLHKVEGRAGNPHKRFAEEQIFGADIMPFAVHLTSANLAAIDVRESIERTQVIQGDSLKLSSGQIVEAGIRQLGFFQETATGSMLSGEKYTVPLDKVNVVLMNPPFTKVERGIRRFVDMTRFDRAVGGEVGLWGHFLALADDFLNDGGLIGAVLPINLIRGRESEKIRKTLFRDWTALYIIKPTRNYAFSESAEYRDILLIAEKRKPDASHRVKFCLIKTDLNKLRASDPADIAAIIGENDYLRSSELDIDSHELSALEPYFANMMWFCGVTDLKHRDTILKFLERVPKSLGKFPANYFREGYRPVPEGVSKFLFLTRNVAASRIENAFLRFVAEGRSIEAGSPFGASFLIDTTGLTRTLRTPVGLDMMDVTNRWDYILHAEPENFKRLCSSTGFKPPKNFDWGDFWLGINEVLTQIETPLVTCNRINPFSPSTSLVAFYTDRPISPSNQLNVVKEMDPRRAKAVCAILNSILFWAQFFLLLEESTGRYAHIRFYDLYAMRLYPNAQAVDALVPVFEKYRAVKFPALRHQFDKQFDARYREFWSAERKPHGQEVLWKVGKTPIEPGSERLQYDLDVCQALEVPISEADLRRIYDVLVQEMIVTRGLTSD